MNEFLRHLKVMENERAIRTKKKIGKAEEPPKEVSLKIGLGELKVPETLPLVETQ
jgi:hypothetical protein